MNKLLAKEDGTTLDNHSLLVSKLASCMCDILKVSDKIKKIVNQSALLHDVGKSLKLFQNILNHSIIENKRTYHNLVGWSVLSKILNKSDNDLLLSCIYWHHSKPELKKIEKYLSVNNDILNEISQVDIDLMVNYVKYINEINHLDLKINKYDKDAEYEVPHFYDMEIENNVNRLLTRSILISADRMSSKFNKNEVDNLLNDNKKCLNLVQGSIKKIKWIINKPNHYDMERFNGQLKVIDDIIDDRTVIVNAPAGYGKSLLGLIWGSHSDKKLLWIVPRNLVAETVYNGLLSELKSLKLTDVSVELYLTKKRKQCTDESIPEFESDIVVTNIDNFLFPIVENGSADRQFSICSRDVVFDECHELTSESAFFYGFVNVMRLRHRKTNSRTLLLSATPTRLHTQWDFFDEKTRIYPSESTHLPAAHKNKYKVEFIEDTFENVVDIVSQIKHENSLVVNNSISNSQIFYNDLDFDHLLHSKFIDDDYKITYDFIMERFGKGSLDSSIVNVCTTPIFEVSADVSFHNLFDVTKSPESTLQRIGRVDRWGKDGSSTITFIKFTDKDQSNIFGINNTYDYKLTLLWFDFLKSKLKNISEVTLDELYVIYNEYIIQNFDVLDIFMKEQLKRSLINLCKIYPTRSIKDGDSDLIISNKGGNFTSKEGLRGNNENTLYFICKNYNNTTNEDTFTDPFTEKYFDSRTISDHFDCDENSLTNVKRIIKKVSHLYKYPSKFTKDKYFTLEQLSKNAYDKERPFIAPEWLYHKKFGFLKNKTINKFKRIPNNLNK